MPVAYLSVRGGGAPPIGMDTSILITEMFAGADEPRYVSLAYEAFTHVGLLIRRWQVADAQVWQAMAQCWSDPLALFALLQDERLAAAAMIEGEGLNPFYTIGQAGSRPFVQCSAAELVAKMTTILVNGGAYGGGLRPPSRFGRLRGRITGVEAYGYEEEELREAARDLLRRWHPEGDPTRAYYHVGAWCDFFMDVAWDHTFLTVHEDTRTIGLLMITDTD